MVSNFILAKIAIYILEFKFSGIVLEKV